MSDEQLLRAAAKRVFVALRAREGAAPAREPDAAGEDLPGRGGRG